jgi:tetratricopeptide (TPR) repeat protein
MRMRGLRSLGVVAGLGLLLQACVAGRGAREVRFDEVVIEGDADLAKLNAEELFASGSSALAAGDYKQAARYFGRISDFHPQSPHHGNATFQAGLSHEKLSQLEEARSRYALIANAQAAPGQTLDATFRLAEVEFHLERFDEAASLFGTMGARKELPLVKRLEAMVQKGLCELSSRKDDLAEATLRSALDLAETAQEADEVTDYFPSKAHFLVGEVYRFRYETVVLDGAKGVDVLKRDLEHKCELLLSAQGHYLRAIRAGNGHWATAAGAQIGELYADLYDHMLKAPVPPELKPEHVPVYREEVRRTIRILISKAISIYEGTLEAAERIGANNAFVERTRQNLEKMKAQLIEDARQEEEVTGGKDRRKSESYGPRSDATRLKP